MPSERMGPLEGAPGNRHRGRGWLATWQEAGVVSIWLPRQRGLSPEAIAMNRRDLVRGLLVLAALAPMQLLAQDQRRQLPRAFVNVFSEVMKEAARGTVEVYSDGSRAALGAIVRSDGHIATKASEILNKNGDPYGKIECQLSFEKVRREGGVVGRDPKTDLALLKIDAKDLPVVPWSRDEPPAVGSWLVTPGFSLYPLSVGVVSVAARKLPPNGALGIALE